MSFIHKSVIVDDKVELGKNVYIWHFSHILSGSKLGNDCILGQNVMVGPHVNIGSGCKIQNNVSIYSGVTCDSDVFLGPSMVFTNVINPRSAVNRRGQYSKTHVGEGASIGANATIVCGNDIGCYAFIGAGAVVTKFVKPYALVVGNPAKQMGWMSKLGHRLLFDEYGIAICPEGLDKYILKDQEVYPILD